MKMFIKGLKVWLRLDLENNYATIGLKFIGKFCTTPIKKSAESNDDETSPVLVSCLNFLFGHECGKPLIRTRICQFVNTLLDCFGCDAALENDICDKVQEYMTSRLQDNVVAVRVQAVKALERIQNPSNPDCPVIKLYRYHLNSDPATKVRQAVLTVLCRTKQTLPDIIDRLWDVDEIVRRHCIIQMSSYPVKSYSIQQRIQFMKQGLFDRCKRVQQVCNKIELR